MSHTKKVSHKKRISHKRKKTLKKQKKGKGGNATDNFKIYRHEDVTGEADEIEVKDFSLINNGANGVVYKLTLEYNSKSVSEKQYKKKKTDLISDEREFALKIPKLTKGQITDNMMFEYIAGLYINKLLSSFPCFIKTERLFMLDIDVDIGESVYQRKNQIQKTAENLKLGLYDELNRRIKLESITDKLVPVPSKIDETLSLDLLKFASSENASALSASCNFKDLYALLIQYFEGKSLQTLFLGKNEKQIPPDVLFQLYAPLYAIRSENLRHLDLHSGNVLIQELPEDITFVYHFDDPEIVHSSLDEKGEYNETPVEKVTIRTRYLVKLVDYGRAYTGKTKAFSKEYETLSKKKKTTFERNMVQCGLEHVLRNQPNTTEGIDLRYIVNYPNYLWALNTQLTSDKLNQTPTNFQIHVDCKKYLSETERKPQYYEGILPQWLNIDLVGIVSEKENVM